VACEGCKGLRVVPEVDESRCDPELLRLYREHQERRARWDAEDRMWARLEGGC
jgi:hypothetical protein